MLSAVGLRVLHISESDAAGGAARSAFKLHRGLIAAGTSRMLVGRRCTARRGHPPAEAEPRSGARSTAPAGMVLDRLDLQYVLYPSSFGVALDPWFREAHVVQLHNVHGSYFSFTALPALSRRRPLVWQLTTSGR